MPHSNITPKTRGQAKRLRRNMTDAESRLWIEPRGHRLTELHFGRPAPVGPSIADFIRHEAKVVVEIDGEQHAFGARARRDAARDAWFSEKNYLTLRFWNHEVSRELDSVTDTIFGHCAERSPAEHPVNNPLPHPPPQGGRKAGASQPSLRLSARRVAKAPSLSAKSTGATETSHHHQASFPTSASPVARKGEGGG